MSTLLTEFTIPVFLLVITLWLVLISLRISFNIENSDLNVPDKRSYLITLWFPISLLGILTLLGFVVQVFNILSPD
mgnify:CR=1 FL=1